MRNLIAALTLTLSFSANATNVTIVDYSKTYEHHYTGCNINLSNDKYLYATCGHYAAPFIGSQQSDWLSPLYDEIGVNGVYWNNCRLTSQPIFSIRFECNATVRPKMEFDVVDAFGYSIQFPFRMDRPYYGPYKN